MPIIKDYTAFMQLYITATQISYCNYSISKMSCPMISVIFKKAFYLIPIKMPLKRYGRFRGYHVYIMVSDYQRSYLPVAFSSL